MATDQTTPSIHSETGVPSRAIAFALVAIILLPGLAYAGLLLSRYASAERARYEQDARTVAQAATSLIDRQLLGWKATLQTLATSAHLRTGDLRSFYDQAISVRPFVEGEIGLRDLDGKLILSTASPFGADLPPSRIPSPVGQAIATPFVSDVFVGAIVDRPLVAVVVPVSVGGEAKYLLHASVATTVLHDLVHQALPPDWIIGVGDNAGRYVLRSDDDAGFRGKPGDPEFLANAAGESGTFLGRSARGEGVLVGYERSDVSGWLVAANVLQSTVERPLWRALIALAGFGGAALIVAGLGAALLWRAIERPLAVLTAAGRDLGKTDVGIALPTRLREFRALRDTLSLASRQLKRDSDELERRVAERTTDLREANARLVTEAERRTRLEGMLVQAQKM
ncbi:hypothetical protein [Bosea sp. ASV33]|uniref:hypothetical protein n=1 Tax=Bosea sp. ASV33 TaxID=2795106 RepID=UPI0032BF7008